MSTSKRISASSAAGCKRLLFPAVDGVPDSPSRGSDADVQTIPTASRLEQIENRAYQDGYQRGLKDGHAAGEAELNKVVLRLENVLDRVSAPLAKVDERVEQELVELAFAIARQIVRRELKTDPGQVMAVIREAVANLPIANARIRVFLHPEDAVVVRRVLCADEEETNWQVVEDPGLTRGGCRMETDRSRIDASVEARLAAIAATIFGGERDGDSVA